MDSCEKDPNVSKHTIAISNEKCDCNDTASTENLKNLAGLEFSKEFGKDPNCAVFAPGCLKIIGQANDYNEGNTICMAIQLGVVVAGSRRSCSEWCSIKLVDDEETDTKLHKFYLKSRHLLSQDDPVWLRLVKSTIKIFLSKKVAIPGFRVIVVCNVPQRRGLGSSSALVVAMLTFLETITQSYFVSQFEKALVCSAAKRSGSNKKENIDFFGDTLLSAIGSENKVLKLDGRFLTVSQFPWEPAGTKLLVFKLPNFETNLSQYEFMLQCKRVSFAMSISSLRDARVKDISELDFLPKEHMDRIFHVVRGNDVVEKAAGCIEKSQWAKLGTILWKNYLSVQDNFARNHFSASFVMNSLKNSPGVLGVGLCGNGFQGVALVLVEERGIENLLATLSSLISCEKWVFLRPGCGAHVIYDKHENALKKCAQMDPEKKRRNYYLKSVHSHAKYYNSADTKESIEKM